MAPITTTQANAFIQSQVAQLLVQPLEQASTFLAAGPTIFDTAAPLRIPRVASKSTVGFVAEGGTIPESNSGFDEVDLMPSNRTSLKVITSLTNESIRSAVMGVDAVLKQRLVTDVALALDAALYSGAGTSNSIKGLINQTGITTGAWANTNPDTVLDGIALLYAANVTPNRIFMNPASFVALRKVKTSGSGEYVLEEDLTAGNTYRLFGLPVTVTNVLTDKKLVIADMSKVAIARDTAPTITVDASGPYFQTDSTAIRVTCRFDLGLLQPAAVAVLTAP
ncbi:phage major capsid protein [Mycolicibacterium sp. NCC-Tsukiji]|uniref:phage major capsid protein n=1 Tax=Mycolicibacterium sp. NCC-Tsukiji TaxID=2185272 RepID=UPI000ECDB48D|nr:phage major capsid protein [Mycolicibacterium sp. NCC-Tsukiji]GCA97173.1 hypothetical protein NCCNTM_08080 [Mycolicibacterium sp. NCC-Tsukiji]